MLEIINESFQEFEENKQLLTDNQKNYIKDKYYTTLNFEYAEGHLCYIFKCKESTYNRMLHYLGFEYEREEIDIIVKANKEVFVVYNNSERIENFYNELEKVK